MTVLVGVDVGGSHTEAVVSDATLTQLARESGPGAALEQGAVTTSARIVADLVERTVAAAGASRGADVVVVGSAGAGNADLRSDLRATLQVELGPECRVMVTSDGEIALVSALGDNPGIIVASGSGSNGFARDPSGQLWRVGGLGWRYGDQGSGYALAVSALEAIVERSGSPEEASGLSEKIRLACIGAGLDELLTSLRFGDRARVAVLARVVLEAASSGDSLALELATDAARYLANLVLALVDRFPKLEPVPVVLGGGVLVAGSPVREGLLGILDQRSDVRHMDVEVDPPLGALAIAARLTS
jgi:N-acetylglucosamine kinase-like BadF-type ATPase